MRCAALQLHKISTMVFSAFKIPLSSKAWSRTCASLVTFQFFLATIVGRGVFFEKRKKIFGIFETFHFFTLTTVTFFSLEVSKLREKYFFFGWRGCQYRALSLFRQLLFYYWRHKNVGFEIQNWKERRWWLIDSPVTLKALSYLYRKALESIFKGRGSTNTAWNHHCYPGR